MDTEIVVSLHNGELHSYQKQWLYEIPRKMDASREYHTEWGNPVTKEQIQNAVTENWILTPESSEYPRKKQNKQTTKKKEGWEPMM